MRPLPTALAVLLLALQACDSAGLTDEPDPGPVDLTASFTLRTQRGAPAELARLSGTARPLDLAEAWTVEVDGIQTYVSVDIEIGDGPTRGVPFVFTAERCPGGPIRYDFAVFPSPGTSDPLRSPRGGTVVARGGAGCDGGTVSVFYIEGFGGVPGEARVYLDDGALGDPIFTTDLAAHGVEGAPGIVSEDDGAGWLTTDGTSVLEQCYGVEPLVEDPRALSAFVVWRDRGSGLWRGGTEDGCFTSFFSGVGYISYVFAIDESSLVGEEPL